MTDSSPSRSLPRLEWALIALISMVSLGAFWSSVSADFVRWDDDINIYRNSHINGFTAANVQWALTDIEYVRRYMPLGWLGWMLNYELDGLNPSTYHLGNLLLHALNSVLVFLLVRKLITLSASGAPKQNWILISAALGALIWAVHPLRTEPVAWASGRIYCQALAFVMISLLSYLRYCRPLPQSGSASAWYWLSVAAYAGSLLTYPLALGFVPVLVIVDVYLLRRWVGGLAGWRHEAVRRIWVEKIPFLAVVGLVFALTFWARVQAAGLWTKPASLEEFGLLARLMQGFYIWAYYVWKTWWPFDLSPLYTTLVSFNPSALVFWLSLSLVLSISVGLYFFRKRWPAAVALWLCHLILLIPVLGLTEHPHFPSDRYSYVAGILWAVLIGVGLARCASGSRSRRWGFLAGTAAVVIFWSMSFRQASVWRNNETLFAHMIQKLGDDPRRAAIWLRLGLAQLDAGKHPAAEKSFKQVLQIKPDQTMALFNLGNALSMQGELEEAVAVYTRLIQVSPDHQEALLNLGNACADLGRNAEAAAHFSAALAQNPNNLKALLALGQALAKEGKTDAAIKLCLEARRLAPDSDLVHARLARAYVQDGRTQEAIAASHEALRLQPDRPGVLVELAWILSASEDAACRDATEARRCAQRANELTGSKHPLALDALAAAYAEGGQFVEAVQTARQALNLTTSPEAKRAIQDRVALYLARQPYREISTRKQANP